MGQTPEIPAPHQKPVSDDEHLTPRTPVAGRVRVTCPQALAEPPESTILSWPGERHPHPKDPVLIDDDLDRLTFDESNVRYSDTLTRATCGVCHRRFLSLAGDTGPADMCPVCRRDVDTGGVDEIGNRHGGGLAVLLAVLATVTLVVATITLALVIWLDTGSVADDALVGIEGVAILLNTVEP